MIESRSTIPEVGDSVVFQFDGSTSRPGLVAKTEGILTCSVAVMATVDDNDTITWKLKRDIPYDQTGTTTPSWRWPR